MADSRLFLVAGLGNPGEKYARTRHNIGFIVLDELSRKLCLPLDKSRFKITFSKGKTGPIRLVLAKPQFYMNRSGPPIQSLASFYKILPTDLIVIHDDLDLEFGRIKIVKDRGHGGHNGIRSIIDALGTKAFVRIRVGVGRPAAQGSVTGHVLGSFSKQEKQRLDDMIKVVMDACMAVMDKGVFHAMNIYNSLK